MKYLLNFRGAPASGKTTAVRQFCEKNNFRVEIMNLKNADIPVSLLTSNGKNIVVIGDYASTKKCTGCDPLRYRNGTSATKRLILESVVAACRIYNPDIIIYEHMITSQVFKATKEIADAARVFGFEYLGIQLRCSESKREQLLAERSGVLAGVKNFSSHSQRVNRATEMLNEAGYVVKVVNTENFQKKDMWKIVDSIVVSVAN